MNILLQARGASDQIQLTLLDERARKLESEIRAGDLPVALHALL